MICIKTGLDVCLASAGMRADLYMLARGAEELMFARGRLEHNFEAIDRMVLKTGVWDVIHATYSDNPLVTVAIWAGDCSVSKRLADFLADEDCPFDPVHFYSILIEDNT